jgi:dTDP-4-dehydrorhamnose 3,5-epimerase
VKFVEAPIAGLYVIELERLEDDRGWFARTFDSERFEELGLDPTNVQCSVSYNAAAGTLRGMHFQRSPHTEDKLVRCTRGAIFDAVVDLRPDSDTYKGWFGVELTPENGRELLIPKGLAHGFQTLEHHSEIHYSMSAPFVPGAGDGVRFDDLAFGVEWPEPPPGGRIIAERDREYPDFAP